MYRRFILCQKKELIKKNHEAIQTLKSFGYEGSIDNIARLRIDILNKNYGLNLIDAVSEK